MHCFVTFSLIQKKNIVHKQESIKKKVLVSPTMLSLFSVTCCRSIRKKWKHMTTMHMIIVFWMLHLKLEAVVRIRGCTVHLWIIQEANVLAESSFLFVVCRLSYQMTKHCQCGLGNLTHPLWCIFTMLLNTLLRWILFCCWPQPRCCVINNTNGSLAAATEQQLSHEAEIHVWI